MESVAADKIVGLGPRCAAWLHRQYPRDTQKNVANAFGVSLGTAKRWLRGYAPAMPHFEEMAGRWGFPFLAFVFAEAAAADDPRLLDYAALEARVAELEAEIARLTARLRDRHSGLGEAAADRELAAALAQARGDRDRCTGERMPALVRALAAGAA